MFKYAKPILIPLMLGISMPAMAQSFDHQSFNALLEENVTMINDGGGSNVDYKNIQSKQSELKSYLDKLSTIDQATFDTWSTDEQLAFLINAYNAWTIELILTQYPDLVSIKDLGSALESPWQKEFIPLLGQTLSLDNIEHDMIRGSGRYNDPRIHFGVNCASIGCPALLNQAFIGETLDAQLDGATKAFLTDRSRNSFADDTVTVSNIFNWYRGDFEAGWRDAEDLGEFLALYADSLGLDEEQAEALAAGDYDISFSEYDWRLNDKVVPEGSAGSISPLWVVAGNPLFAGLGLLILLGLLYGGWRLVKRRKTDKPSA